MAWDAGAIVEESDIAELQQSSSEKPIVKLTQTAAQNFVHATNADITFAAGSTDIDTHNFHDESVNNTRVTPTVAGYYRCTTHFHMAASAAGNYTQVSVAITKNGTRVPPQNVQRPDPGLAAVSVNTTAIVALDGIDDYVTAQAQQQNSTSATRASAISSPFVSTLEVEFLRPL